MPTYRAFAAALGILSLSACAEGFNPTRGAAEAVALPDGMVIAGARGWCVDDLTTRQQSGAAVVVFGSCAAIARNAWLPRPAVRGVVTVSVEKTATELPPPALLERFLTSEAGRAALARDGRASSLDILETLRTDEALILHAVDRSGWPAAAAEDYWRALFDIDGRFVSVSLVGLGGEDPIDSRRGIATLRAQIARLKSANAI